MSSSRSDSVTDAGGGTALSPWPRLPRLRANLLPRSALHDLLSAFDGPLILVCGAAGYGKTTLIRQWIENDPRRAAWLTLGAGDEDPLVFARHLVRALHEVRPLPGVVEAVSGPAPDVSGVVIPALLDCLERDRDPFVLVLDDLHRVTNPDTLSVVEAVVEAVPAGSQVALIGREVTPRHLTRRLLDDGMLELDQLDLTFTESEATELLRNALPSLDDDTVRALVDWTEAWPALLHLAILALRENRDLIGTVRSIANHRHVSEYFRDELLGALPEETRDFLVRTAVLERFTPALCDALLDTRTSAALLEELASSGNLFVTDFEGDDGWVRYHRLFADLLVAELRRTAPGDEFDLRRKAARWLSDSGFSEDAVDQALATGDRALAAGIIWEQVAGVMSRGELASLERWLGSYPVSEVRAEPKLALTAGWLAFGHMQLNDVEYWLDLVERLIEAVPPDVRSREDWSQVSVGAASLRMVSGVGGIVRAFESACAVRSAGPVGNPWWTIAPLLEANGRFAIGEECDLVELFSAVEVATRDSPVAHALALAHLAFAHLICHQDERAESIVRRAIAESHEFGLDSYVVAVNVQTVHALVAARRHEFEESQQAATRAERLLAGVAARRPAGIIDGSAPPRRSSDRAHRSRRRRQAPPFDSRFAAGGTRGAAFPSMGGPADSRHAAHARGRRRAHPRRTKSSGRLAESPFARRNCRPSVSLTQHRQVAHGFDLSQARSTRSKCCRADGKGSEPPGAVAAPARSPILDDATLNGSA